MTKYQTAPTVPLALLELQLEAFENPRTTSGVSKAEIAEFAADIHEHRIRIPILVLPCTVPGDKKVHLLVIDGQRRTLALRTIEHDLGKAKFEQWIGDGVPVTWASDHVVELTVAEADAQITAALAIASKRVGLSSYEVTMACKKLLDRGMSQEEAGEVVDKSRTWVSRMVSATTKADPKLLENWEKGKLTDEAFKDLAAVPKVQQVEAMRAALDVAEKDREAKGKARVALKEKAGKPAGTKGHAAAAPRTASGVLAELVALGRKSKPGNQRVQGIIDGVAYALGEITPEDLGPDFLKWMKGIAVPAARKKAA